MNQDAAFAPDSIQVAYAVHIYPVNYEHPSALDFLKMRPGSEVCSLGRDVLDLAARFLRRGPLIWSLRERERAASLNMFIDRLTNKNQIMRCRGCVISPDLGLVLHADPQFRYTCQMGMPGFEMDVPPYLLLKWPAFHQPKDSM